MGAVANPVDIAGDADATRYLAAFEAPLEDQENDAILVMNVPTALASELRPRWRKWIFSGHRRDEFGIDKGAINMGA